MSRVGDALRADRGEELRVGGDPAFRLGAGQAARCSSAMSRRRRCRRRSARWLVTPPMQVRAAPARCAAPRRRCARSRPCCRGRRAPRRSASPPALCRSRALSLSPTVTPSIRASSVPMMMSSLPRRGSPRDDVVGQADDAEIALRLDAGEGDGAARLAAHRQRRARGDRRDGRDVGPPRRHRRRSPATGRCERSRCAGRCTVASSCVPGPPGAAGARPRPAEITDMRLGGQHALA